MSKSVWTRLCLIGLIICCSALCYAQGENISHCSTFLHRIGGIQAFASSGQYSYVLIEDWLIATYDISDIMHVNVLSTTALGAHYDAILAHEEQLFVFKDSGMLVYDLSQPTSPVLVSTVNMDGSYQGAAFYEDHLITHYNRTLAAWDITSYAQPLMVDDLVCPNSYRFCISGSNAIVANVYDNYLVVDLLDPTSLQVLGTSQGTVYGTLRAALGSNLLFY